MSEAEGIKTDIMKRIILSLTVIFITVNLYSEPSSKIDWDPVPGAWGYLLEVKDSSGNIIISKEIRESQYSVAGFEPGEYSFRIATLNMMKQRGENTGWTEFTVEKLYMPKLIAVSKKQMVTTYTNRKIILTGDNFRPESVFILRGNGTEIKLSDVEIVSEKEVHISYKPPPSAKGKYDIAVVNKGDVESVLKDAIEIVEPAEVERFYFIGGGYLMSMPSGAWADYMAPSYAGGELFFQVSLKNPLFENILLAAEIDAAQFSNVSTVKTSSLKYASLGFGAGYYYPLYTLNMEVFLKFNTGPMYSVLTLDENVVGRETASYDWFVKAGAGLRIYFGDNFFLEPACSWKTAFYTGEFIHLQEISFSAGVKI